MEFSRRGPATEEVHDGRRFSDPPSSGDPMLVMRDALLSQLQRDRLRMEIIVAELAKIERALALRAASSHQPTSMPWHSMSAADVEWAKPWSFTAQQFMPQRRGPFGWERYADMGEEHDVNLPDNDEKQRNADLKFRKPVMEDHPDECLKPYEGMTGQSNAAFDDQRSESSEIAPANKPSSSVKWELTGITIPVKKPNPPMKWSCAVCQVQSNTERNLLEHYAGKKHQSNVAKVESRIKAIGQKFKTKEESSLSTKQKKTSSIKWSCSNCQVSGTSELDLEEHLKGKRHLANIAALCKEGNNNDIAKNVVPQEAELHESNVIQHAANEKPPSLCSCSICQAICSCESDLEINLKDERNSAKIPDLCEENNSIARNSEPDKGKLNPNRLPQQADKTSSRWSPSISICHAHCTCQSDLESHLTGGKRYQLNIQSPCEKTNQEINNPTYIAKNQKQPSLEWNCCMCQAKSNSESQCEHHCRRMILQQRMETMVGESKNDKSLKTANELPSDGSNINASLENVEEQATIYFCEVCTLHCNSEQMLVHHRSGKKHSKKVEQQNADNFCDVCNLQCHNSKMLADHRSGKKHSKKVEEQNADNFCDVCDLQCDNSKMLADHLAGKKHRSKLTAKE